VLCGTKRDKSGTSDFRSVKFSFWHIKFTNGYELVYCIKVQVFVSSIFIVDILTTVLQVLFWLRDFNIYRTDIKRKRIPFMVHATYHLYSN